MNETTLDDITEDIWKDIYDDIQNDILDDDDIHKIYSDNDDNSNGNNQRGRNGNDENQNYLKEIYNEIKQVKLDICSLKTEINNIEKSLEIVSQSTSNMNNHISFVESVWTVVRNPFSHVLQLYYGKNENINLPPITTESQQILKISLPQNIDLNKKILN